MAPLYTFTTVTIIIMNDLTAVPQIPHGSIYRANREVRTTSLAVAEIFGKQHAHVLRDIRRILETLPELRSNFGEMLDRYTGPNGNVRYRPAFSMDRKGFEILTLGFTGEKALRFRVAYVNEFHRMKEAESERDNYREVIASFTPSARKRIRRPPTSFPPEQGR